MPYSQLKLVSSDDFDSRLRDALTYYPETGELRWIVGPYVGKRAGYTGKTNRRRVVFEGVVYYADELIYRYVRGRWPDYKIIHLNGDRFDDKWENLSKHPDML